MPYQSSTETLDLEQWVRRALSVPTTHDASPDPVPANGDEHAAVLDRVARARCAEALVREDGCTLAHARQTVALILDTYADSTRVRR